MLLAGYEFGSEGDALLLAFHEPLHAVRFAVASQSALTHVGAGSIAQLHTCADVGLKGHEPMGLVHNCHLCRSLHSDVLISCVPSHVVTVL